MVDKNSDGTSESESNLHDKISSNPHTSGSKRQEHDRLATNYVLGPWSSQTSTFWHISRRMPDAPNCTIKCHVISLSKVRNIRYLKLYYLSIYILHLRLLTWSSESGSQNSSSGPFSLFLSYNSDQQDYNHRQPPTSHHKHFWFHFFYSSIQCPTISNQKMIENGFV